MPDSNNATKTLVMSATYNEIENLPRLVDGVFAVAPEVDFLAVDDNSPDGTGVWADQRATIDKRVRCLHRAGKQGLGSAIIAGMRYASEHGYRHMLNIDADFSHHPRYLPAMISGMDPANGAPVDVMIGSRYIPGGGTTGWPMRRKLMSRGVNLYARWCLWLSPHDCSGGYRCYRVAMLEKLDLGAVQSSGYSFQEEILWMLHRAGARIAETPIIFADRERGQSKINGKEAVTALRIIATLGARNLIGR
ncbi:MAG: polyprenol monophosphomannose synthase [Planctomycetota bacterium]|nr:polyprenol monophosphomannose synthase [Planctomycetota bacterium]